MPNLNLPGSKASAVWAVIWRALQDDQTYPEAGVLLISHDGDRLSTQDLADYNAPVIRFTPSVGAHGWADQASVSYPLVVAVEIALVPPPDSADMLNLQRALLGTLNTIALDLQRDLVTADATTGLILFDQPFRPQGDAVTDGRLRARGGFSVEVLDTLG